MPPAHVTLQINGGSSAEIAKGESMFLMVSLSGNSPTSELRVGVPGRPWSARLRFETADGKPFPVRIDQLGPPASYRFDGGADVAGTGAADQTDEAVVSPSRVSEVESGISPDEAARIEGGSHSVRAVLSLDRAADGQTQLVSNTVRVTIRKPPDMGGNPFPDSKPRLVAAARFYLRAQKWEDAHRIALQLVERQDADAVAYTLLADALNGLERNDEALAAYRAALASLPTPLEESPDYLFARIDQVQGRIDAAKGKKQ